MSTLATKKTSVKKLTKVWGVFQLDLHDCSIHTFSYNFIQFHTHGFVCFCMIVGFIRMIVAGSSGIPCKI